MMEKLSTDRVEEGFSLEDDLNPGMEYEYVPRHTSPPLLDNLSIIRVNSNFLV